MLNPYCILINICYLQNFLYKSIMYFCVSNHLFLLDFKYDKKNFIYFIFCSRYQVEITNLQPGVIFLFVLHAFTLVYRGWDLILILRIKMLFYFTHMTI